MLTLLGYSDADYEDKAALLRHVTAILTGLDPKSTIINIGATSTGIGAVYELAKTKGFTTSGIISTLARESGAKNLPCADLVFFVKDTSWGGFVKHTNRLSPTSATIVDVSDSLIAIGGGDVARDEFRGAERAGKTVTFIPADMNHAIARERARRQGRYHANRFPRCTRSCRAAAVHAPSRPETPEPSPGRAHIDPELNSSALQDERRRLSSRPERRAA